jgi:hypothetical protein
MSFTTACAEGFECFVFIFVPYSHYDEPKTLSYFTRPVCLLNADGGHATAAGATQFVAKPYSLEVIVNAAQNKLAKVAAQQRCFTVVS